MHRTTYAVQEMSLGRWRDSRSITVIPHSACNHNKVICSVLLVSNQICMNARWVGQSDYTDVRPRWHVSLATSGVHVRTKNCSLQCRRKVPVGRCYSTQEIIIMNCSLDILAWGQSWSAIWGHSRRARMRIRHPGPDICSRPSVSLTTTMASLQLVLATCWELAI